MNELTHKIQLFNSIFIIYINIHILYIYFLFGTKIILQNIVQILYNWEIKGVEKRKLFNTKTIIFEMYVCLGSIIYSCNGFNGFQ